MTTLAIEFDYAHEHAGWIDCWLTVDSERHHLSASQVFPPFLPLLYFVKAIAGQRFPASFYWDEEGVGIKLDATAVAEDSPLMHLKIRHDEADVPWLDADVEREMVIQAFLSPLIDISQNFWLAEFQWSLPRGILAKVRETIAKGIPLRSDTRSPQRVDFVLHAQYDDDYLDGQVFLQIWLDDERKLHFNLQDTDPFWPQLADFMNKVASIDLPAQCLYNWPQSFPLNPMPDEADQRHHVTRIVAESITESQNFRLKVYSH